MRATMQGRVNHAPENHVQEVMADSVSKGDHWMGTSQGLLKDTLVR